ncbi:DUF1622 domain-containing protein [Phenylobacterium sp. J367]|uniref:DUF1622 domain-containing protein n=1 Tax=Phenylobacterium sp. J367 TaxID=2898435 RepID=UPI002151CD28|nr:DUF1622 domain-containing protein [Phenylobacterium sp. J367]MCR5878735.1 DUF1622 domain-containing protein [Phenylobacterium sp. J367]
MEQVLRQIAAPVAAAADLACILCIAVGGIAAFVRVVIAVATNRIGQRGARRGIFRTFGSWIVLSLEFALAADIVRTAIAPTWQEIGQLAAIAAIWTALNYFLERDLEVLEAEAPSGGGVARV